jgi:hypothetical protein
MKPIQYLKMIFVIVVLNLCVVATLMADPQIPESEGAEQQTKTMLARKIVLAQEESFQVVNLSIGYVVLDDNLHFKIIVDFNKNIDLSHIHFGNNVRWLVKDVNGNYIDAYPEGGHLQVEGKQLIWTSKSPAIQGSQKLLLKGTLKSVDGKYLDCDGDGDGEGGNLPTYESIVYDLSIEKI